MIIIDRVSLNGHEIQLDTKEGISGDITENTITRRTLVLVLE